MKIGQPRPKKPSRPARSASFAIRPRTMRAHAPTRIVLSAEERTELEGLVRSTKTEYRLRQRARIVLLAAGGGRHGEPGDWADCRYASISFWATATRPGCVDSQPGAAGFEPLHIRIGIRQDSQPGGAGLELAHLELKVRPIDA